MKQNDRTLENQHDSRNDLRIALRVREEYLELPSAMTVAGDTEHRRFTTGFPRVCYITLLYPSMQYYISKNQILR